MLATSNAEKMTAPTGQTASFSPGMAASPGPGCASHPALRGGGDVFHHADLYDAADHGQCWGISGVEGEKKGGFSYDPAR